MVAKANIRHNFGVHDDLPMEQIVYHRSGGWFVSYRRCAAITIGNLLLFSVFIIMALMLASKQLDNPADSRSLPVYIAGRHPSNRQPSKHSDWHNVPTGNVVPINYRLLLQPTFNRTAAGNLYGTVWMTFTPNIDRLQHVTLHVATGVQLIANSVFVYRSRIWNQASFDVAHEKTGFRWIVDNRYDAVYDNNTSDDASNIRYERNEFEQYVCTYIMSILFTETLTCQRYSELRERRQSRISPIQMSLTIRIENKHRQQQNLPKAFYANRDISPKSQSHRCWPILVTKRSTFRWHCH